MITVKLTKAPGYAREFVLGDNSDINQLLEQADVELCEDDVVLVNEEETEEGWILQNNDEIVVMVLPIFDSITGFDLPALVRDLNARFSRYHALGISYNLDTGHTILLEKIRGN